MRRDINDIQIQEPPMQEFGKKRSCLKRSCFTGCGCMLVFLIGTLVLVQFVLQPRSRELKDIPDNFPSDVHVYDTDAIYSISYTSAADRSEWVKKMAAIPKTIIIPVIDSLEAQSTSTDKTFWTGVRTFLNNPITKEYDTVRIEWKDLSAQPTFINEYYQNELKKNNFAVQESARTETIRQSLFTKEDTNGVVYIQDDPTQDGTDYVSLTVNYSAE